jgi:hypothetical protein
MPGRNVICDFETLYRDCAAALDAHEDAVACRSPRADVLLASALFLWGEVVAWMDLLPLTEGEKAERLVRLSTCRGGIDGSGAPAEANPLGRRAA